MNCHLKGIVAVGAVVEVLSLDNVDNRHEDARWFLFYPLHQWLQPLHNAFAMRVEKDESVSFG